ncbi:hypothetical protein GCM10012280_70790 [Wenjunlia tyrosinilytica]|uniref:Uncharacterized protein n=2 Tax=Wenjunlia tyrosinilytica TaxID=1544741 RepID=A0A918A0F6_9ACTN|nr:hypothetical protein GCM10012280_70790 [Wenjunlia tyrosinilytica]
MGYLMQAAKAAAAAVAATLAGWRLFESLYVWADHAADTEVDSGQSEWFAGTTQYLVANATGWVFLPVAVWGLLRLIRVRGNHLAIIISAFVWVAFTAPHLVGSHPSPATVVAWVAVQTAATAAASVAQSAVTPANKAMR